MCMFAARENAQRLNYVIFIILTTCMVIFPLWLYFNDITVSTHFEESVGYRYFHSLRIAFSREQPWLPQGQISGIFHILLQYALTLFGHENNELFPRIDLFILFSTIVPFIISGILCFFIVKKLSDVSSKLLFATFFLLYFFSTRFQDGWDLLPDYHVWIVVCSLVSCCWILYIMDPKYKGLTYKNTALLGLFAGSCVGLKCTLVTLPLAIFMIAFIQQKNIKTCLWLLYAGMISIFTWLSVIAIYYKFDYSAVKPFLFELKNFNVATLGSVAVDYIAFVKDLYPSTLTDVAWLSLLISCVGMASILTRKLNSIVSILFPIGMLELYILAHRNYSHTHVEFEFVFFFLLFTMYVGIKYDRQVFAYPKAIIKSHINGRLAQYKAGIIFAVCTVVIAFHAHYVLYRHSIFTEWVSNLNETYKKFTSFTGMPLASTLYLLPIEAWTDEYNFITIDNGMYKAAQTHYAPEWKLDSYLGKLFPERGYSTNSANLPANIAKYNYLAFRTKPGQSVNDMFAFIGKHYKNKFPMFDCDHPVVAGASLNERILVLCSRKD